MFTVVITTYNRLDLLKRAIQTSLDQTVATEVLVVDDCSQDGTQAYCEALMTRETRFRYLRNHTNQGHSRSVNRGIEAAQGDWIKLLDDDDYLAPDCLAQMEKAIALCPTAVICSCQAAQVNDQGVELSRTPITGPGEMFTIPQGDIHYGMLIDVVPFGTPVQVAFRRDAFIQTQGWDSHLDTNFDDIDSWMKLAEHGDAVFINQCLTYRTIWPGGYNHRLALGDRLAAHLDLKQGIYNRIPPHHQHHCPPFGDIAQYLKLHWSLAALKQRKIRLALGLADGAIFSLRAWQLLWQIRQWRRNLAQPMPHVEKRVLTPLPTPAIG